MECPSCGEEIEDGSQFCRFCGEEIPAVPDNFDLKSELQSMDDYEFEHFVADLWEEMGWNCEVSTASNDKGIDVRATKTEPYEQKALIQVKRYGEGNKVGSPDIQQYSSLKHQEDNVDKVIMVTSSSYSRNAEELASDLNVKLINGDALVGLVEQADAEHLVEEYIDITPEDQPTETAGTTTDLDEVAPESQEFEYPYENEQPVPSRDESDSDLTVEPAASDSEDEGEVALPDTPWTTVVGLSSVGWILFFALDGIVPDAMLGLGVLVAWVGVPLGIYRDSKATRDVVVWPKYRKTYLVISAMMFFGILAGGWYLLMRRAVAQGELDVDRAGNESDPETEEPEITADNFEVNVTMHGPGHAVGKDYEFEHHSDALGKIQELKDEERNEELERLLKWCISETEQESRRNDSGVVPHYYEELAKLYRKHDMHKEEVEVLEQFAAQDHPPGKKPQKLMERLGRARQLAEQ